MIRFHDAEVTIDQIYLANLVEAVEDQTVAIREATVILAKVIETLKPGNERAKRIEPAGPLIHTHRGRFCMGGPGEGSGECAACDEAERVERIRAG